jgi:ribonuclease P protein component
MLAKPHRLVGKDNFDQVLKEGKIVQSESFGMAYFNRGDGEVTKYGFVVSTKVSKEAVGRNRVKRALSEAVRFLTTKVERGYNVVFLAKGRSVKIPTDALMREVDKAVKDAGLIK